MAYLAALLSGLLLTLSFTTVFNGFHLPDLSILAWIGLVPLIVVCRRAPLRRVALASFIAGTVFNALVSYWIFHAMNHYGGLSPLASLAGVLAMATLLGVMQALIFWLVFWLERQGAVPLLFLLPFFWMFNEWLRNYGPFGGYPWSQLAYSQGGHLTFVQIADIFGIYGLSALIVFVNCVMAELCRFFTKQRRFPASGVVTTVLLLVVTYSYGHWRLAYVEGWVQQGSSVRIGIVQPNIPQELKWQPVQAAKSVQTLKKLTQEAVDQGAEFVLWPESAYPDLLPSNLAELYDLAESSVTILTGAVSVISEEGIDRRRPAIRNSAFQFSPGGMTTGIYSKTHLVPLGEYVPLKNVLSFLDKVVPSIGDFHAGTTLNLIEWNKYKYGVTICYEDLFPEISREFVAKGADFLTNVTNDAWYGDSSAQWQHLEFSRFRVIENRRPMLRSTNTGVSAIYAASGRTIEQLPPFQEQLMVKDVVLGGPNSFYTRFGDVSIFVVMGFVLAIMVAIKNIRQRDVTG